jgi:hypothetical protein
MATAPKKPKVDQSKETRVYTADMGQPPMDPEVAPPTPKPTKAVKSYARGGGIEQRGKTRGKIC